MYIEKKEILILIYLSSSIYPYYPLSTIIIHLFSSIHCHPSSFSSSTFLINHFLSSLFIHLPHSSILTIIHHLHPPHSAGAGGCSEGPSGGQSECVGGVEAADPTQRSHHQVHRARTTPRSAGREGGRCKGGQGGCY